MSNFETWWEREGQEFLYALNTTTDDDIKLVAEVAWKNGAYCAEQAEQPVSQGPVIELFLSQSGTIVGTGGKVYGLSPGWNKLYAAPVRTKDLTDDEIDGVMWIGGLTQKNIRKFARAVIAADREKNR